MKYRSRPQVMYELLKQLKERPFASQTKLMYWGYLSHNQIKEYLPMMVNNGLIESNKDGYRITALGRGWLDKYDELDKILPWRNIQ